MAGFWSKDEILAGVAAGHPWQFAMLLVATFLTAFYVFRVVLLVFWGPAVEGRDRALHPEPTVAAPTAAAPGGTSALQSASAVAARRAATTEAAQEAALEAADREHGHAGALRGVECGGDEGEATTAGRVIEPDACEIDALRQALWADDASGDGPPDSAAAGEPHGALAADGPLGDATDSRGVAQGYGPGADYGHAHDGPVHESGWLMTLPLIVLAVAAVGAGFAGAPFLGSRLQTFIGFQGATSPEPVAPAQPLWITLVAVGLALAGIGLAWLGYGRPRDAAATWDPALQGALRGGYGFVARGYGMDALYGRLIVRPYLGLSRFLAGAIDTVVIDGAVNGIGRLIPFAGRRWRRLQAGDVRGYLVAMTVGALLLAAVLWKFV